MSEAFLKNPLSLFDIKGKTAIITGASGAFGALAAKTLAGAGANVVLAASKQDELKKVAAECEQLGGKTETVAKDAHATGNLQDIVARERARQSDQQHAQSRSRHQGENCHVRFDRERMILQRSGIADFVAPQEHVGFRTEPAHALDR